jgi:hypothetical protein
MMARRDVVGGGVLAGIAGAMLPAPAQARSAEQDRGDQAIVDAIDKLRAEIGKAQECGIGACPAIASIRMQQNNFLKTNQKFPDFIDAGIEVWEAVYDWHVRNRQPITTTRLLDGRYGIAFMFTTVVLRPENTPNFLSFGYDAR